MLFSGVSRLSWATMAHSWRYNQIAVSNGVEALEALIDAYHANGDLLPDPKLLPI
jgi:hypothetical protein